MHFNGRLNTERIPNTCNVSFIGSEKFLGKNILSKTTHLEASTGSCCHSNSIFPSRVLTSMGLPNNIALNSIRLSVGRETTKEDIDLIVQDLKLTIKKILLDI